MISEMRLRTLAMAIALAMLALLLVIPTGSSTNDVEDSAILRVDPTTASPHPWGQVYGDYSHTSRVEVNYSGKFPMEAWNVSIGVSYSSNAPIITEDDHIYVNSDEYLRKYAPNGTMLWNVQVEHHPSYGVRTSSPCLDDDGFVYIGGSRGLLHCLDPDDGHEIWNVSTTTNPGGYILGSAPVYYNGTVIFGPHLSGNTAGGFLQAVWTNGTVKWKRALGEHYTNPPVIAQNGTIYMAIDGYNTHDDDFLLAISENGDEQWMIPVDGEITEPCLLSNGSVVVLSETIGRASVECFGPDGNIQWHYRMTDKDVHCPTVSEDDDGSLFFVTEDDVLYKLYPNGSLCWTKQLDSLKYSAVTITDDMLIVQSYDGIYFLDKGGVHQYYYSVECTGRSLSFNSTGSILLRAYGLHIIDMVSNTPVKFVDQISSRSYNEDDVGNFDFDHAFYDNDLNETLTYTVEGDNDGVTLEIVDDKTLWLTPPPHYHGIIMLRIVARDKGDDRIAGNSDDTFAYSNWFNVTFRSRNDDPVITPVDDVTITEKETLSITMNVTDVDHDPSLMTWWAECKTADWIYMRNNILEGTPTGNSAKDHEVDVYVRDPDGAVVSTNLTVTVTDVNEPPIITQLQPLVFTEDRFAEIDVGNYESSWYDVVVSDPDLDKLTVSYTAGPGFTVTSSIYSHDADIYLNENWWGETYVDMNVTDGEFTVSKRIPITVESEDDGPENVKIVALTSLDNLTVGDTIRLRADHTDPDNGQYPDEYQWVEVDGWDQRTIGNTRFINYTMVDGYVNIRVYVTRGSRSDTDTLSLSADDEGQDDGSDPYDGSRTSEGMRLLNAMLGVGFIIVAFILPIVLLWGFHLVKARMKGPSSKAKEDTDEEVEM